MKITKVEAIPLLDPCNRPMYDAVHTNLYRKFVLVRVETDTGLVGYGESGASGGPLDVTKYVIEHEIAPKYIGQDPFFPEKLWRDVYVSTFQHGRGGITMCAISGVDIAVWDIIGKALGVPVYKLLGAYSNRVKAYASGGFYFKHKTLEDEQADFRSYVEKGFKAVKLKLGRNYTPSSQLAHMPQSDYRIPYSYDIARVAAIREAVGPDVDIMVDANCNWDLKTALRMGREFEKLNVYALEEPLSPDFIDDLSFLTRSLDIRIAGYETERGAYNYERLIRNRCMDIVQPDVAWAGGFTEVRKIAAMAYANNMDVFPHCFSGAIGLAVSAQMLASCSNCGWLEMDMNENGLRTDLLRNKIEIEPDGYVTLPELPGIGADVDEERVAFYHNSYLEYMKHGVA